MPVQTHRSPDITFVVSPANALSVYMPFYFLYLAGYLEKRGFSVEILNPHEKDPASNVASILRELQAKRPRYVGLACFVTDYHMVYDLCRRIKNELGLKTLVGNAHPSIAPEDFLDEGSPFDIVVRGEGELTVSEILSSSGDAGALEKIGGVAFRRDGAVHLTEKRKLMDLAQCGMPAYHLIDVGWYRRPTKNLIRRLATVGTAIYTGRGCPFKCTFCASNTVWNSNRRADSQPIRKRPLPQVMEELRILQDDYGFDFFYVLDDTFGVREKDILDFCDAYKNSGLEMLWGAETRVGCISNEQIIKVLKDAGCIQLDFGVESGSPRMLKAIRKGCTVERVVRAFGLCKKGEMRTFANILVNLPGEDIEDLRKTEELLATIRPTYTSIGVTQPYPGTEICGNLGFPLSKEDYRSLNRLFPDNRFRLCVHDRDLRRLLLRWFIRYGIYTPVEWSLFRAGRAYWSKILSSKHRLTYIRFMARELLVSPFRFLRDVANARRTEAWN
ncbi:MAG: radical SAM protein [Elusimicrobiota bacterium]